MSRFNELGPLFPFNTDILRPTAIAIITIYHLILLPFFILSKTPKGVLFKLLSSILTARI